MKKLGLGGLTIESLAILIVLVLIFYFIFKNEIKGVLQAPSKLAQGLTSDIKATAAAVGEKKTLTDTEIENAADGILRALFHGDYGNSAGFSSMVMNLFTDDNEDGAVSYLLKMGSNGDVIALTKQIRHRSGEKYTLQSAVGELSFEQIEEVNDNWASKGITMLL